VLAPDLALVEVGLGRVDRHKGDLELPEGQPLPGIARAEGVLEAQIADVPSIVVTRDEDSCLAGNRLELGLCERVLVGITVVGQIAGDDDEIRLGCVDLLERRPQELLPTLRRAMRYSPDAPGL